MVLQYYKGLYHVTVFSIILKNVLILDMNDTVIRLLYILNGAYLWPSRGLIKAHIYRSKLYSIKVDICRTTSNTDCCG